MLMRESMCRRSIRLLAVLAVGTSLSACVTSGGADKTTSPVSVTSLPTLDPMDPLFAPPPPAGAETNGSQRVPLGDLAPNADTGSRRVARGELSKSTKTAVAAPAKNPPLLITSAGAAPAPPYTPVYTPPASQPQKTHVAAAESAKPAPSPVTKEPVKTAAAAPVAPPAQKPKLRLPNVDAAPPKNPGEDLSNEETVVISSATPVPQEKSREFVPALLQDQPAVEAQTGGSMIDRPMSAAEKNIVQRFEVLKRLLDEGLITPEEYARHRNSNIGALLPFTRDPPAVGLERPNASPDAIVARLQALRRALEMRSISPPQHASERSMILQALLPSTPDERMPSMSPPSDVIQGAAIVTRLQTLKRRGLITADEFEGERQAIDRYLRTGTFKPSAVASAKSGGKDKEKENESSSSEAGKSDAKAADKKKELAGKTDPAYDPSLTAEVPGPVLHLASFRSVEAAHRAWQDALNLNKALLGPYKQIVRKVDLGEGKGVFFRLMVGPFASLSQAEATCIKLKANNQFCRASADGS
jgi:hypothetical protein